MTYIAGFIEKKSIFLISDTAITTTETKKNIPSSSFGESPYIEHGKTVFQSELKIFNLNDRLVVGGAGNSFSIDSFIENLKSYLNYKLPIRQSINSALENIDINDFELLIGIVENSIPIMYRKSFESLILEECTEGVSEIGVKGTHFANFKSDFSEIKVQTNNFRDWNENLISVVSNSILQAYGIWNYTLSEGVGGVFTSLYLNAKGIQWQPSLGYVIFDINIDALNSIKKNPKNALPNKLFTNSKYIFIAERENSFYISSPKPNYTGFIFRQLDLKNRESITNWFDKHEANLLHQFEELDVEYLVFICSNTHVIRVFKKQELEELGIHLQYGKKLKLQYSVDTEEKIEVFGNFMNQISQPYDESITVKV